MQTETQHSSQVLGSPAPHVVALAMAMHGTLVVLLTLCGLVLGKTDPGFDLFVFVRSYSPTFCRESACTIKPM